MPIHVFLPGPLESVLKTVVEVVAARLMLEAAPVEVSPILLGARYREAVQTLDFHLCSLIQE